MSALHVQIIGDKEAIGAIRRFSVASMRVVREATNRAAIRLQALAKQACAVDTGRLRSSIAVTFYAAGLAATVGTNVTYARAVEFGSKAHVVEAKPGGVLRWVGKDGVVRFAKRVTIPAQPARPFLYPAWYAVKPAYIADLKAVIVKAGKESAA